MVGSASSIPGLALPAERAAVGGLSGFLCKGLTWG